jgi:hypothetical protein
LSTTSVREDKALEASAAIGTTSTSLAAGGLAYCPSPLMMHTEWFGAAYESCAQIPANSTTGLARGMEVREEGAEIHSGTSDRANQRDRDREKGGQGERNVHPPPERKAMLKAVIMSAEIMESSSSGGPTTVTVPFSCLLPSRMMLPPRPYPLLRLYFPGSWNVTDSLPVHSAALEFQALRL